MSRETELRREALAAAAASQVLGPLSPLLAPAIAGIGRHEKDIQARAKRAELGLSSKASYSELKQARKLRASNVIGGWCWGPAYDANVARPRRAGQQCPPGTSGIADAPDLVAIDEKGEPLDLNPQDPLFFNTLYRVAPAASDSMESAPTAAAPSEPTEQPMGFDFGGLLQGLSPLLGTISPGLAAVANTAGGFLRKPQVGPAPQPIPPPTYQQWQPPSLAQMNLFGAPRPIPDMPGARAGAGRWAMTPSPAPPIGNIPPIRKAIPRRSLGAALGKVGRAVAKGSAAYQVYRTGQALEQGRFSDAAALAASGITPGEALGINQALYGPGRIRTAIGPGGIVQVGESLRSLAAPAAGGSTVPPPPSSPTTPTYSTRNPMNRLDGMRHPAYGNTPLTDPITGSFLCSPGYRLRGSPTTGYECIRPRRMNPTNVKALSRAGRRISSFVRIAKRFIHMTSAGRKHASRPSGFRFGKRRSKKCCK